MTLVVTLTQGTTRAASAAPEIVVEITPEAREVINARVTRRLIRLELADIRVAPNPMRSDPPTLALFYRLLLTESGELRIELWERGEFYGARRVSTAHGDKKLLARHIALATAELAQRLSRAHSQKAKELEREAEQQRKTEQERREREKRERWALVSQGEAAWLPGSKAWLAGPRLGFQLNHPDRGRLDLSFAWLFGTAEGLPDTSRFEWLELRLVPQYRFDVQDLGVGVAVAANALSLSGPVYVDRIANQRQTWSARVALHLEYEPRLTPEVRLQLALEPGVLMRNVQVADAQGSLDGFSGLWLGLSAGVVLDP